MRGGVNSPPTHGRREMTKLLLLYPILALLSIFVVAFLYGFFYYARYYEKVETITPFMKFLELLVKLVLIAWVVTAIKVLI